MLVTCPFCDRDPFHYVDNGLCMEAVAVTCCDLGDAYFRGERPELTEDVTMDAETFIALGSKINAMRRQIELEHTDANEPHAEQVQVWADDAAEALLPWLKEFDDYEDKLAFFRALSSELKEVAEAAHASGMKKAAPLQNATQE